MKRILTVLLVISLTGVLAAGCAGEAPLPPEGYAQVNFNNALPLRQDFYFFDQGYFYQQDGFYNMGVYKNRGGEQELLFQERDFGGTLVAFYVHGDDLYFSMMRDGEYLLYRYDLRTDTPEQLWSMGCPRYMGVLGDSLVYQDRTDPQNEKLMLLDLSTGQERTVFEQVEAFGLVNGEVRCIVRNGGYEIHRWDPVTGRSEKLCGFSVDAEVTHASYGFTAEHVVMYAREFGDGRTFLSCSLADGMVTKHTVPKDIHELVAGDDAVFLLAYDSERNTSNAVASPENGVYRVDLSDGSWEQVVEEIDDQTELYVVSDDSIVLIQRGIGLFFRANRTAYRYDLINGTREKIGTLSGT